MWRGICGSFSRAILSNPEKPEAQFGSRIGEALSRLEGLNERGFFVRVQRQEYDHVPYDDYAILEVFARGAEWSVTTGIMASQLEWDGDSLDFFGSQRLARLLADWKDAIPEIRFTRGDGTAIEYEKFIDHGGDPLAKTFDDFFDDILSLLEVDPISLEEKD